MDKENNLVLRFNEISIQDVPLVGGKNASLGEMFSQLTQKGISIPNGFALTAAAYWHFLNENKLVDPIKKIIQTSNLKNVTKLEVASDKIRKLILSAKFPADLEKEILDHYRELSEEYKDKNLVVAVRSSATAEDLPSASFAGAHETYLNVSGNKDLLVAIRKCISSLFLARAIAYREEKGFEHMKVALSVGIMKMVRSDLGSSGVMFTLDTETGFQGVVSINSIWGVGEMIVKGEITPDQFYVFKPTLELGFKSIISRNLGRKNRKYIFKADGGLKEVVVRPKDQLIFSIPDSDAIKLAEWACAIEKHYGRPQDIEWAKDGKSGELFIVQSRPETIFAQQTKKTFEEYEIETKKPPVLTGIAVGSKIGTGKVKYIPDISKISQFQSGEILVTKMTDPDWMPIMRIASAIVTDEGGKTCHAAIVSRELGLPAIVGTGKATRVLKTGQTVTVDCTQGSEGRIYAGKVPFKLKTYDLESIPKLQTKIMANIGLPESAFKFSFLPVEGVGLAREEFIMAEKLKVHPLALLNYEKLKDRVLKKKISDITIEHKDKKEYFIEELAEGVGQIAAAFYPRPVIVRFSDFKSNEYSKLVGGELYEPKEDNPMLGFRGASRYYSPEFKPAFEMECKAIKKVREEFGLKNIWVMIPFCRTVEEGKKVLEIMAASGLKRGENDLKVVVMCEIPANVILAKEFLEIFDGMSIGSNDLTQLTLGLDRDSAIVANVGNERNEAVKEFVRQVIAACKKEQKYIGICGEAPSNFLDFAEFLVGQGINSMSLNPDSVIKTILRISEAEKNKGNIGEGTAESSGSSV